MSTKAFLLLFILVMVVTGCSRTSPIEPGPSIDTPANGPINAIKGFTDSINQIWMTGTMIIKPEIGEGQVIYNRNAEYNYDITSFLAGGCPGGCFTFKIVGIQGTVLEVELKLENPTSLQAYDVRLIYEKLYGKKVLNPSSYTDLFKLMNVRPFTAFATESPTRAFPTGPGGIDTETLFIDFPPGSQAAVNYKIVASYPSNTGDPYEIRDMNQQGPLTPSGGLAMLGVKVLDHQGDITRVRIDTTKFTGGISEMLPDPQIPGQYYVDITNSEHAPVGSYNCIIMAESPNKQNVSTYNYMTVTVSSGLTWGDVQPVHFSPPDWYSVDPDVAFDSQGHAHIAWTEVNHTGYMEWNENIWYSNNISGEWSTPIELSDLFQNTNDYIVSPCAIAINNADRICVVWTQCLFNGDRAKLWWNFYNGSSWSGQQQMFNLTLNEVQPQLTSDDQFFYLAFRMGGQSGNIMFSGYSIKWSDPVPVNDPIDMVYELQLNGKEAITAASRGGIFITWLFYDMNPDGIWVVMNDQSWDGGTTWGPDKIDICDERINQDAPSIAMGNSGTVYALWLAGNYDQIRWDKYEFSLWGTDKILFKQHGATFPAFSVMPDSHQNVCYIDAKALPYSLLYFIESADGETWSDPFQVSPNDGESEAPSVATQGTGKVGVTWKQHLGIYTNDILYREANY